MKTLFVVAHRSGARLLVRDGATLASIEEIDHPEGRLHNIDRETDRAGRTHDSSGRRHALSSEETSRDHVALELARRLAKRVGELRTSGAYQSAVLVAEPKFLGFLRGALDDTTAKTVSGTIAKDLSQIETRDLGKHLTSA